MDKRERCAICGQYGKLTFDHVPPKAAANSSPQKCEFIFPFLNDKKYKNFQRGIGYYSLCEKCNNNIGSWYTEEFLKFYNSYENFLSKPKNDLHANRSIHHCEICDAQPLKLYKQILSMFCSVINNANISHERGFDKYLTNRENLDLDSSTFTLHIYLITSDSGGVINKLGGPIFKKDSSFFHFMYSEIVYYPFGFILNLSPKVARINLPTFPLPQKLGIDKKAKMTLELPYLNRNTSILFDQDKPELIKYLF